MNLHLLHHNSHPSFILTLQPVVRKQHNSGYKHKSNVKSYYMQFEPEQQAALIAELNGHPIVSILPLLPTCTRNPI